VSEVIDCQSALTVIVAGYLHTMVPEKSGNASSRRNRVENERAGGGFRFFFGSTSDRGKAISLLLVSLIKISVINFSTPRWPRGRDLPVSALINSSKLIGAFFFFFSLLTVNFGPAYLSGIAVYKINCR
jgi:hypothetical protein